MKIQIVIINEFGEFKGEVTDVTKDQYEMIVKISKDYYKTGFEMVCEDKSYLILPPEIIKKSIYKISIVE